MPRSGLARQHACLRACCHASPGAAPAPAEGEDEGVYEGAGGPSRPLVPWSQQFKLLARRSWKQVVRDKATSMSRLMANVSR